VVCATTARAKAVVTATKQCKKHSANADALRAKNDSTDDIRHNLIADVIISEPRERHRSICESNASKNMAFEQIHIYMCVYKDQPTQSLNIRMSRLQNIRTFLKNFENVVSTFSNFSPSCLHHAVSELLLPRH